MNQPALSAFIWSVADLLRGDYKQSEYGKVILPFTVLRRLDCVLEATKPAVLAEQAKREKLGVNPEPFLLRASGQMFFNTSALDVKKLIGDADHIKENLYAYIQAFSPAVRDIFECFDFYVQIERLAKAGLLYQVTERFAQVNLHPKAVGNTMMGAVFEELIRKFAEISNETAGEHFTPREVIRLMVDLLFVEDNDALSKPGVVRTLYDPTGGTGGMLSVAAEYLAELNPKARLTLFGQELNPESYAICKADMLIRGQDISNIVLGNTLSDDGLLGKLFDYMLSNPPFGVEWKKIEKAIRDEYQKRGYSGRFGPGLPRVSDGSLLFLLHLLSKMRPAKDGGSRFGIVLNGSPLFTGGAGSGESEIRRFVLENDLVEAIIGLPTDMFYNTGIATYVWVLSNRKQAHRKGKVQLIDASSFWQKMRKSLGSKRKEMSETHIADVTRLFGGFVEAELVTLIDTQGKAVGTEIVPAGKLVPAAPAGGKLKRVPLSRIFRNEDFGYCSITVERPQRDADGRTVVGEKGKQKGKLQPDAALRDTENVPLSEGVQRHFDREVKPHAPDAWIDPEKTKVGYEIPFSRIFYVFEPPRPLAEIDAELIQISNRILTLLSPQSRDRAIANAVTKGLDPAAPMKDSGVEWLGQVPMHWNVQPLKHVVTFRSGGTPDKGKLEYWDGDVPWASAKDLKVDDLFDTSDHITHEALDVGAASLVPAGSVLVVVRGMILARMFPVTTARIPLAINQDLKAVTARPHADGEYLAWLLRASAAESMSRLDEAGHGTKALRMDAWGDMRVPVPPLAEQKEIADYLRRTCSAMDAGLGDMQRGIALLQERRTAVVSAAVTGQIDVRHIAALEAAPVDSATGRFVAKAPAAHLAWVSATAQAGDIEPLS